MLVEGIIAAGIDCRITAVGTNSIATAAMLKAGAQAGATGENPVLVAARDADVIIGPLGLLVADSLLGEITPAMAQAVGRSQAVKLLLPVNMCNNRVVGAGVHSFAELVNSAVSELAELARK